MIDRRPPLVRTPRTCCILCFDYFRPREPTRADDGTLCRACSELVELVGLARSRTRADALVLVRRAVRRVVRRHGKPRGRAVGWLHENVWYLRRRKKGA